MKGPIIITLLWLSSAIEDKCLAGEFFSDGYVTGQNIDIDLQGTKITQEDVSSVATTFLSVQFLVPQIYEQSHRGASYAITFNRKTELEYLDTTDEHTKLTSSYLGREDATDDDGNPIVVDNACMTTRYYVDGDLANNKTQALCSRGTNLASAGGVWVDGGAHSENDCLQVKTAKVEWANVMTSGWFGKKEVKDNGRHTEVFLLATVETWSRFTETVAEGSTDYLGQMTGNEEFTKVGNTDDRTGKYSGDGGNPVGGNQPNAHPEGWNFPALHMDDERYTLYQIPFILRFPKSVVVTEDFNIDSKITTLTGLVSQDQILVNLNPDVSDTDTDKTFAVIDVTIRTEVQYPFAVHGPFDNGDSSLTVVVGDDEDGSTDTDDHAKTPAKSITPIFFNAKESCRNLNEGDTCFQDFKFRIVPKANRPCSVAGKYTMEFWAACVGGIDTNDDGKPDNCSLDDKFKDTDIAIRRQSNGYFLHTFEIAHTRFCPEVIDTVKVHAELKAYHSEDFATVATSTNVFTNDVLFYEATYSTSSDKDTANGGDSFIDYVRAVDIKANVIIGQDMDAESTANNGWSNDDWKSNLAFSLGGSRVAGDDFSGDDLTLINTPETGNDDYVEYEIQLCQVDPVNAYEIQMHAVKATDCFEETPVDVGDDDTTARYEYKGLVDDDAEGNHTKDSRGRLAAEYLDFNKVQRAKGTAKSIDENEIAFKLRLDERIMPVGPDTDDSHVKITVLAEVYYKGNRSPSRRRLQNSGAFDPRLRSQRSIQTHSVPIHYRAPEMKTCHVNEQTDESIISLTLKYSNAKKIPDMPSTPSWSTNFVFELEQAFGLSRNMEVVSVKHGSSILMSENRDVRRIESFEYARRMAILHTRRLELDEMEVQIRMKSNDFTTGGEIVNVFQERIVSGEMGIIPKVGVFKSARIVKMDIADCNDKHNDFGGNHSSLESSATIASTLFAFLVALVHLL